MATDTVQNFESLFSLYLAIATVVGVLVLGWLMTALVKYRRRPGRDDRDEPIDAPKAGRAPTDRGHASWIWLMSGGIAVILFALAFGTLSAVHFIETPPEGAIEIQATAYRYGWTFEYPQGFSTRDLLVVPAGTNITIHVTSLDVIHKLQLNDYRVGVDAVPGRVTTVWFRTGGELDGRLHCAELCGPEHALMKAPLRVLGPVAYMEWVTEQVEKAARDMLAVPLTLVADAGGLTTDGQMYAGTNATIRFENGAGADLVLVADDPVGKRTAQVATGTSALLAFPVDPAWVGGTITLRTLGADGTPHGSALVAVAEPSRVAVTLKEWDVALGEATLRVGVPVILDVTNAGGAMHDLTLGRYSDVEDGRQVRWQTPALFGGDTAIIVVVPDQAIRLDAWCSVPGHVRLGMLTQVEVSA